jgi:selenocysteine lyase/cysteine desulfurase
LAAFSGLQKAIEFVNEYRIDTISNQIDSITSTAKSQLSNLGLIDEMVLERKQHSSIFNIPGDDNVFKRLTSNGILAAQRGGGIRISFSYYNDSMDLYDLIACLNG